MAQYLSPGVYVEEVPSAVRPIAGVSTSTGGFIGVMPNTVIVPQRNPKFDPTRAEGVDNSPFFPPRNPTFKANETESDSNPRFLLTNPSFDPTKAASPENFERYPGAVSVHAPGEAVLCTTFNDFTSAFGAFSTNDDQNNLAHAVYGFFTNGGSSCYVARALAETDIASCLTSFEAIDEIAIVAAPGLVSQTTHSDITTHCALLSDRFAILDIAKDVEDSSGKLDLPLLLPGGTALPDNSDYAATYFPWIAVADPARTLLDRTGNGLRFVPPSGHVAGVYARVDTERGVHKAPANEVVRGALGVRYRISRTQQNSLNPQGVNAIRDMNGNIRVWGARTIGGDKNAEWKYVNVRRLFLFLRESIDEGTQWVVFEPNDQSLWAKITRNVTAFLTNVWRDGALFGDTPEQAFYVKCDAETNPPEVRNLGRVVTEIGVAVVEPAEFVIFRISQWSGPGG
jgi:phage tail sheath protein FI